MGLKAERERGFCRRSVEIFPEWAQQEEHVQKLGVDNCAEIRIQLCPVGQRDFTYELN